MSGRQNRIARLLASGRRLCQYPSGCEHPAITYTTEDLFCDWCMIHCHPDAERMD